MKQLGVVGTDKSSTMIEGTKTRCNWCFGSVAVALIAFELCKVGAFIAAGQAPLYSDAFTYWCGGERIVAGDWLLVADPAEVTRTPGYLLFVAFFQATFGAHALAAAIVAQHLLLLANCLLACWASWRLTKTMSAVLVCLALSLFCISSHGVAVNLLCDTLLAFCATLCVAGMIAWFQSPTAAKAAALGVALGAMVMVKPVAQLAWAPVAAGMLFAGGSGFPLRRSIVHAACFLLAAGLVIAPWLIRNEVYFGGPFLTKFGGRALWWSCFRESPNSSLNRPIPFAENGTAMQAVRQAVPDADLHDTWRVYKELVGRGFSQIDADDLMLRAAKEAIQAHPWDFVRSRVIRFVWFWITPNGTYRPNTRDFEIGREADASAILPGNDEYAGQSVWKSNWYFTGGGLNVFWHPNPLLYALAAASTLAGLIYLFRLPEYRALAVFLGLWLAYFSTVTVIAGSPEYRYRMILEPTMIVVVATAWCRFRFGKEAQQDPGAGSGLQTA